MITDIKQSNFGGREEKQEKHPIRRVLSAFVYLPCVFLFRMVITFIYLSGGGGCAKTDMQRSEDSLQELSLLPPCGSQRSNKLKGSVPACWSSCGSPLSLPACLNFFFKECVLVWEAKINCIILIHTYNLCLGKPRVSCSNLEGNDASILFGCHLAQTLMST